MSDTNIIGKTLDAFFKGNLPKDFYVVHSSSNLRWARYRDGSFMYWDPEENVYPDETNVDIYNATEVGDILSSIFPNAETDLNQYRIASVEEIRAAVLDHFELGPPKTQMGKVVKKK